MKTKPTPAPKPAARRVAAQRIDAAYQFDMSPVAAAEVGAPATDYTQIPVLPRSGAMGRDGRGPFTYNVATVVANVLANGADVPIFLNHETGKAYGWIDHKASPIPMPDGSWEWPVRYTPEGQALLSAEAYRYNSPTWLFLQDPAVTDRQAGEIVGLLENSLVNLGNQYLRSLNAAEQGRAYTVQIPTLETDPTVTPEQLAALGLAPEATPEQITAAIITLAAAATKAAEITTAVGAPADADVTAVVEAAANFRVIAGALVTKQAFDEAITARDAAVSAQALAVTAQAAAETALQAFQATQAATAVNTAVDGAITAGKFTPAMRTSLHTLATKDLTAFTDLAAATSQHAAVRPFATPDVTDTSFGLNAEQLAMCKAQNIKPELLAKNIRKTA
jgi:hypothetical protein